MNIKEWGGVSGGLCGGLGDGFEEVLVALQQTRHEPQQRFLNGQLQQSLKQNQKSSQYCKGWMIGYDLILTLLVKLKNPYFVNCNDSNLICSKKHAVNNEVTLAKYENYTSKKFFKKLQYDPKFHSKLFLKITSSSCTCTMVNKVVDRQIIVWISSTRLQLLY